MKKYNLGLISKNRDTIYGLTILWIMFFHSSLTCSSPTLTAIKNLGRCGVDIFFLVSGISLYFSFQNSNDCRAFYIKRLKRVIIPTMLIIIPWCICYSILYYHYFNFTYFILGITGLCLFVTGDRTIWFITAIIIFFLFYPLLYRFYKRYNNSILSLLLLLAICALINYSLSQLFSDLWTNSEIFFRRIPVFIIGAYLGKYVFEENAFQFRNLYVIVGSVLIVLIYILLCKYMDNIFIFRYLGIPFAFGTVILFSMLGNIEPLSAFMSFFAPVTLEIYLCHEKILFILSKAFPDIHKLIINILSFLCAIAVAYLISYVCKSFNKHIFKNLRY